MTEAEWLVFPDTMKLKRFLGNPLSRRKCLLAVCAYGVQIAEFSSVPHLLEYLREWEAKADVCPVASVTIDEIHQQRDSLVMGHAINTPPHAICSSLCYLLQSASDRGSIGTTTGHGLVLSVARAKCPTGRFDYQNIKNSDPEAFEAYTRETAALAHVIWDTLGNPFRPVTLSPEWRTDTAVILARQMYESREFSAMPILADALQDAGCDNEDVLNHCRQPGEHVRGCLVVDLLLGKE